MSNNLFTPVKAGSLSLRNRIVMAPMTRSRADAGGVPGAVVPTFYAQRSGAGLIISEGIYPAALGKGYLGTPGLHTPEQVAGWKKVTVAVHAKGGTIVAQIMYAGRISHPSMLPGGATPVAPSAVRPEGQSYTTEGLKDHVTPRALETSEIAGVVAEYGNAARLALEAGFDGVELHSASGYLPMQFLSSNANLRIDGYGGSAVNRSRFVVEVLDAMIAAVGADRVGIKLSPGMQFNDISDANPADTYRTLVSIIGSKGLAYVHVALFGGAYDFHSLLRPLVKGAYFAGGGLTQQSAEALIAAGKADAAVFGASFIANPDLPARFEAGAPLAKADRDTYYVGGEKGYIDYPALAA